MTKKVRDSYDNKELYIKKVNEQVNPNDDVKVELISSPSTKINTQQRHATKMRSSSGSTLVNRHFDKLDLAI